MNTRSNSHVGSPRGYSATRLKSEYGVASAGCIEYCVVTNNSVVAAECVTRSVYAKSNVMATSYVGSDCETPYADVEAPRADSYECACTNPCVEATSGDCQQSIATKCCVGSDSATFNQAKHSRSGRPN